MSRKEFRINEYLELKLHDKTTHIYVNGEEFHQCKYLLFNIKKEDIEKYEDITSIDDAVKKLDRSNEIGGGIPPETEFWGHCSNLQAWSDNDYDTRLLHSNLAFPLLNQLAGAGDPRARKAIKEEIACRFEEGNFQVKAFLIGGNYLNVLTKEELETLFLSNNKRLRTQVIEILEDKDSSMKKRDIMNFLRHFIQLGDIEAKRMFTQEIMNNLTFEGYKENSIHYILSEGYLFYLDLDQRKELLIRTMKEGALDILSQILTLEMSLFKDIAIDDESVFSPNSLFIKNIEKSLFSGSTSFAFSILRDLHKGGAKPAKKLIEKYFIQFFKKVDCAPSCFYDNAELALECFNKEERIELAQKVSSKIHAFLIIHYETLKKGTWLRFNEGHFTILINRAIGIMDRVNDDFNPDNYHIIKLNERKHFKKIKMDNHVNYDFHLIVRKENIERYFLSNVNFRIAFSLLNKDSEGILCIPKDPSKDSRFRMTSYENNIVIYIAPKVMDLAGLIEFSIKIKERMLKRINKRQRVLFVSLLTHYLKHNKNNLKCKECLWSDASHGNCDLLTRKQPLLRILDDYRLLCKHKEIIAKLGKTLLKNRLDLSRTRSNLFKRELKVEALKGKNKTVKLKINNPEGSMKIKTNSTKLAVAVGKAFDEACQEIAETFEEKKVKQESKKSRIKQTSINDFFSSDKNKQKAREILISGSSNKKPDKIEEGK